MLCIYSHTKEIVKEARFQKSSRYVFGYYKERKAYQIWDKDAQRIPITHNVIFHESTITSTSPRSTLAYLNLFLLDIPTNPAVPWNVGNYASSMHVPQPTQSNQLTNNSHATSHVQSTNLHSPQPQHSHCFIQYYGNWARLTTTTTLIHVESKTY
jgi:hypothetical protein